MADIVEIKFNLGGRELSVPPGTLVIEAARREGIEVPSFCYYRGLALQAACRMCLVEVEKAPKLQTACTLIATEGMVVHTDTPQVHEARKAMLEFLLVNHPLDCPVCDKGGECELQDMTFRYGADRSRFVEEKLHMPELKWSNIVYYDAPRCILCFRCVRVCDESMDVKALGVGQRGAQSVIIPNQEGNLECEECGMCIDICPVGALTSGTYRYQTRPWEMQYVPTVCAHCSNGCKTTLSVSNHEIVRANNRDLSGLNSDFLCAKGRFAFDFTRHPNRLRQPLVRRDGKLEPTSWEDALDQAASRLAAVRARSGADAIGFCGSNRTTNEENYLLGRIARAAIGTNHVDHHRTADYSGLIKVFAEFANQPPAAGQALPVVFSNIGELASTPAFLLIGNDPSDQNPLVAWQIRAAIRHHGARLYIVDADRPKLVRKSKLYLQVVPGQEIAAVAALTGQQGAIDLDPELTQQLRDLHQALAAESNLVVLFGSVIHGAALDHLATLARTRTAEGKRTGFVALGDYANSRGASDMGLLPDLLPGYASIEDPKARAVFSNLWGATLPEKPGLAALSMLEAAVEGRIKALYVVGADPVTSHSIATSDRLGKLDLLIVHDMFLTETARLADIVLPALCAYEKDGTMTNTTGEVQLVRKAADFMGPRSDFDILRIFSHLLARHGIGQPIRLRTPGDAFEEIRQNVGGYNVSWASLLAGSAEMTHPIYDPNGHPRCEMPVGTIFSSRDTLFTSGSLTPYCRMIQSLSEAGKQS